MAGVGVAALALGLIGIVIPGLPTTPFILVAAACFSRASPRLHHWLLSNRQLGPLVRDWERNRSLPLAVKWISTLMMTAMVLLSAWHFADRTLLQVCIIAAGLVGAWVVWRIPTRRATSAEAPAPAPTSRLPQSEDHDHAGDRDRAIAKALPPHSQQSPHPSAD